MGSPSERAQKHHKHKCLKCGTTWSHPGVCDGHMKSHTCPNCGQKQWLKYRGRKEVDFRFDERH